MKIQYYSPHFNWTDLFCLANKSSDRQTVDFFKEYTGKKNVLLTASCRASLYLTYAALDLKCFVAVSPLTCCAAIEPILWSDNKLYFVDVKEENLLIDNNKIIEAINAGIKIIQIVNLGGKKCSFNSDLLGLIKQRDVFIVEDCAQSFSNLGNNNDNGLYSDVQCFTLTKTSFGIGGGVLATNDDAIYKRAIELQEKFPIMKKVVVYYRIVKNICETNRRSVVSGLFYNLLVKNSHLLQNKVESFSIDFNRKYLVKPVHLFFKVFIRQLKKTGELHTERNRVANRIIAKLKEINCIVNYDVNAFKPPETCSKLYVYHPRINSYETVVRLHEKGIEAKHLEQRSDSRIQERFDIVFKNIAETNIINCQIYKKIHDHLISIPLLETMGESEICYIVNTIKELING